ncbi:MAG TPA: hypothetical protein VGA30_06480, partial [Actinomycetota bacterium]
LRRRDLRDRFRSWREEVRAEPWAYGGGFAVLAAVAVTRLTYSPALNLADQTPLRYWADGLEIADAHRIPSLSLQWGRLFPTTVSKVVLNAFSAGASLVLGRGPLGPMGALLVVASVGLLLVTFALARELGLRLTAPFVVILLFANHVLGPRVLTDDLTNYRAETWGRLLVLAALLLAVRALRSEPGDRGLARREAVASGTLFGLAAGTHLVPCVVGLAFLGAYGIGVVAFDHRPRLAARVGAVILGVAAVVGAFVLFAPRGDVGFQGAGDTAVYRKLAVELGLPPAFDPTRFLALGQLRQPAHGGAFYEPPSVTYHEYIRRVVGEDRLRRPFLLLVPLAGAAAFGLLLWRGPPILRALAVACALTALAILVVALAFEYRFDVYVLAEFGPRRLFDYTAIPAVLLGAAVVELLLPAAVGPRAPVLAVAGLVALAAFAVPRNVAPAARERFFDDALPALRWIGANVPCDGRVLADRRTLATFETLTRHGGAIEGMGPYLRPAVLTTAIRSLLDARRFFLNPGAGAGYLRRAGVAAVVVTTYDQTLGGVGGPLKFGLGKDSNLDRVSFLRLVARSSTVRVYEVRSLVPPPLGSPDVRNLPGYRCGSG